MFNSQNSITPKGTGSKEMLSEEQKKELIKEINESFPLENRYYHPLMPTCCVGKIVVNPEKLKETLLKIVNILSDNGQAD